MRGDKLFRIEMTLMEVPYGMRSAFHAGAPANLSGTGTGVTAANPCDRGCLDGLVEQVLQAMLAHDASKLPLAKGVRYSENGQFLAIGDGLWGTAGKIATPAAGQYAARFADPASGTAAYWGLTNENGTTGVLALRVKVASGKISEIEAIDVREESQGPRGGTVTLMRPPLPIELKAASLGSLDPVFQRSDAAAIPQALITAYFDGLEQHSGKDVKFAPGCTRRDNAIQGASGCAETNALSSHATKVRDRRILVADAERGVVMAVAMIDNPGVGAGNSPSTYMVPELIKIENGSITRVEGLLKWMPYGYSSAWAELKK
jgi:hypothetical protein